MGHSVPRPNLRTNIQRALEETDSLLDQLRLDKSSSVASSYSSPSTPSMASSPHPATVPTPKRPAKAEREIAEELDVANAHLRRLVDALFEELDAAHRENAELRARCQRMEAQLAADNRRKVEEDSFVPELEPLEMPTFDFDQGM